MNIDIILPYKEIFSKKKASAVSLTVKNSMEYSEFKSIIKVYGQFTNTPFIKVVFPAPISPSIVIISPVFI